MKNNPKRVEIIKTAIRCIGRYGIESTSAELIAKTMGIAQSGIFYYFPTQEDLFDSLDGFIAKTNHDLVTKYASKTKAVSARARLEAHLHGNLHWADKHPDQVCALLISIAKTGRSRSIRSRMNKLFQVGENRIEALLREGAANGEFAAPESIPKAATFLHKSLTGFIVGFYYSRHERNVGFYQDVMKQSLNTFLKSAP